MLLAPPAYAVSAITATPSGPIVFAPQSEGYIGVSPEEIKIKNDLSATTTTAAFSVTIAGTNSAAFTFTTTPPTSLAPNEEQSVYVYPVTGLAPGVYTAEVLITDTGIAPVRVPLSFTVNPVSPVDISYQNPTPPTHDFGEAMFAYVSPNSLQVVIKNDDTSFTACNIAANFTGANASAFMAIGLPTDIAPSSTATVTIKPVQSLAVGAYEATLTIGGSNTNALATISLSFRVTDAGDRITSFYINGYPSQYATINHATRSIELVLPYGTPLNALVPIFTLSSGASCTPPSGAACDFSNSVNVPVEFAVQPAAGSTPVRYYARVQASLLSSAKEITSFVVPNMLNSAIINHTTRTIALTVPYGTPVYGLVPSITVSSGAVLDNYMAGAAYDFTYPVDFTVRAQDNSTATYSVTVNVQNYVDNYASRTLTDSLTGTRVYGARIHTSATLSVVENSLHAPGSCAACDGIRAYMASGAVIKAYNIELTQGFEGSVQVSIPVGSAYNGQVLTILHCLNRQPEFNQEIVQNGMITGTYSALSPFAVLNSIYTTTPFTPVYTTTGNGATNVVDTGSAGGGSIPPKTDDKQMFVLSGILVATGALLCAVFCTKHVLDRRQAKKQSAKA
jgi:hypothetical protein